MRLSVMIIIKRNLIFVDGTLGGYCSGLNGETCDVDKNAECQRGICVCKNGSIPGYGSCRQGKGHLKAVAVLPRQ